MEAISKPNKSLSILLVEDEQATLEALSAILVMKYPDVALYTATNGKAGLELFKEHMQDIIITDINMPELSGVQLADKIRVIKSGAKIIVLTAETGKIALEHAAGVGSEIDHYITKPLVLGLLFSTIEQCLVEIAKNPEII